RGEPMRTLLLTLLICLFGPAAAFSQDNPLSTYNKTVYEGVKGILLRSAEKMPEENFNFKPTDAVRSYGQILGHVADASATQTVKLFGRDTPKLGVLTVNNIHTIEHYGNLVTYMRLKNIVPPTSEPGFMPVPQPKK